MRTHNWLVSLCLLLVVVQGLNAAPVSTLSTSAPLGSSTLRADSLGESSKLLSSESAESSGPALPVTKSPASEESSVESSVPLPPVKSEESSEASSEASSETSTSTLPKERPDPVGKLIDNLVEGKPVNMRSIGIGKGHTIALANKNDIYKEGPDDEEEDNRNEEQIKRGTETGQKRHQEELGKIHSEGRSKKINLQRKKVKSEERGKAFDDELRTTDEQFKKKGREEETKNNESALKKVEEAENKRRAALDSTKRAEQLQKAQMTAAIQQAKSMAELEKKKAAEEIEKTNAEAKLKLDEAAKKHELEASQKKRQEVAQKRAAEVQEKKRAEERDKAAKRQQEQEQKAKEQQRQEQAAKAKQQVEGRTCQCTNHRVNFRAHNTWINCPGGYLLTGLHRNREHLLRSIEYYQCCRPCRDDGSTVLGVQDCVAGQWQRSFDSAGWSNCPDQTYISGFYKSSCELIYCIEHAHCCRIAGSRGRKGCGAKGSWGTSLDGPGWSVLDGNHFMIGLYRSGGHWLYNIEYPNQCTFFAY